MRILELHQHIDLFLIVSQETQTIRQLEKRVVCLPTVLLRSFLVMGGGHAVSGLHEIAIRSPDARIGMDPIFLIV